MSSVGPRAVAALIFIANCLQPLAAQSPGDDLLARSVERYATLASYSDTGTVVREAPGLVDQWKFRTHFRRSGPDLFFDFQGVTSQSAGLTTDASAQRMILWMIQGELQSYRLPGQWHEIIPRETGNQPAALQRAVAATAGTSILIPSLLFSRANLPGTILQMKEVVDAGFEPVDGHRCRKVTGFASEFYKTGRQTNIREVTVWIDAETLLIRKVFEDTPEGYLEGSYSRLTVTLDPQANPDIEDGEFAFTIPESTQ
jgi:hypothetical protein